ncbi:TPA: hypothetical protein N0F65_001869 [Lagenidium giganteum]|uniref:Amine oxidase n=1 Tax=Lagenidium giganteum TaxID=4803 RepID=A0AAV2YY65_9STRA|nr:TPA: hypothetical protein N0F65_001869 [Lagenidium giganteum]
MTERVRVAVVGAGFAGLAAAHKLVTSNGLRAKDIVILEAQDRVGGRVKTVPFSAALPFNVEVGAAWIHGADPVNPLVPLATQLGISLKEISARNPWMHPESCDSFYVYDGPERLSEADVQQTWRWQRQLLAQLRRRAVSTDVNTGDGEDRSIATAVSQILEAGDAEWVHEITSIGNGRARLDLCLRLIEIWMGSAVDELQLEDFEDVELFGDNPGPHCIVPAGMERFIDALSKPVQESIRTNTRVDRIDRASGSDGRTLVQCSNGVTYDAEHVLVTTSLGYLKTSELRFEPALPEAKQAAIDRSQMGHYMKVLLRFPHVFWPETAVFIGQTQRADVSLNFPVFFNYHFAKSVPVLETVLIGEAAAEASKLSDEEIVAAAFAHVSLTFGNAVPAPIENFITRWNKDRWALGAYSCLTVHSTDEDPALLREPVDSKLFFAGEATNYLYQGALQAAYLSGIEAAADIAQLSNASRQFYNNAFAVGEFRVMAHLGHERGDSRFVQHRRSWITKQDIEEIHQAGLNTVRVPVGFWIMGSDPTDGSNKQEWRVFAPNALSFLDELINDWCGNNEVTVLISVHAAKGSQNGREHSAPPTPGTKYWSDYPENVNNTVQLASFLAERYRNSPAFLGLCLLNEPEYPVNPQVVRDYYHRAYTAIRKSGNDCVLVVAPMLTEQGPPHLEDFMRPPTYQHVWVEWHPYFIWGYENQSADQVLNAVHAYKGQVERWRGNALLISEWSLGAPSSAFPAEDLNGMQRFARAQLDAFAAAAGGWTFWTWRHAADTYNQPTGWSLRQLLRQGTIKLT